MFDGKVPHWHHFSCFWLRAAVQSTSDISGFTDLRWDDQEKVKKAIETGGATGGNWFSLLHLFALQFESRGCSLKSLSRNSSMRVALKGKVSRKEQLKARRRSMNLRWSTPNPTEAPVKGASRKSKRYMHLACFTAMEPLGLFT